MLFRSIPLFVLESTILPKKRPLVEKLPPGRAPAGGCANAIVEENINNIPNILVMRVCYGKLDVTKDEFLRSSCRMNVKGSTIT